MGLGTFGLWIARFSSRKIDEPKQNYLTVKWNKRHAEYGKEGNFCMYYGFLLKMG